MFELKSFVLDLHLHDDAGEAGTDGNGSSSSQSRARVEYGKADDSASQQTGQSTASQSGVATGEGQGTDRKAEFERLIKGDYKDLYEQRVQAALNRRFKNQNDLQSKIEAYESVINPLIDLYATDDMGELRTRVLNDNGMFEQAADEMGMSLEQYAVYMDQQRKLQQMEAEQAERDRNAQAQATYSDWENQAEALKEIYPNFDLASEVESHDEEDGSNRFIQLLSAGVDVKTAYEALHLGDIMTSTAQQVGEAVRNQTVDTIRARGMRPAENGLSEQAGVIRKSDPSKFTAEDRKEIVRRAHRGETIKL